MFLPGDYVGIDPDVKRIDYAKRLYPDLDRQTGTLYLGPFWETPAIRGGLHPLFQPTGGFCTLFANFKSPKPLLFPHPSGFRTK